MTFFKDNKIPSSLKIPKVLKLFFKVLHFISVKLSLIVAARIFTTPFTFKTPKRELIMLESSQRKQLKVPLIDKEIEVLSYGYSKKKVLLAHGWSGRSTQLYMIAHKLLEKGFMVISLDAPAHGKSTGKTTDLTEYIETIKKIISEYGPFEAAVGHSFGCMALINTQSQTNYFKTIVTVGSGDKVTDILTNFSKNLGLTTNFANKLIAFFEKKWSLKVDDYATSKAAKKVSIPVLVVHDSLDGDVDVSSAIHIRQNLNKGKLLITNGLGHTKILRNKEISNRIVKFIIENT